MLISEIINFFVWLFALIGNAFRLNSADQATNRANCELLNSQEGQSQAVQAVGPNIIDSVFAACAQALHQPSAPRHSWLERQRLSQQAQPNQQQQQSDQQQNQQSDQQSDQQQNQRRLPANPQQPLGSNHRVNQQRRVRSYAHHDAQQNQQSDPPLRRLVQSAIQSRNMTKISMFLTRYQREIHSDNSPLSGELLGQCLNISVANNHSESVNLILKSPQITENAVVAAFMAANNYEMMRRFVNPRNGERPVITEWIVGDLLEAALSEGKEMHVRALLDSRNRIKASPGRINTIVRQHPNGQQLREIMDQIARAPTAIRHSDPFTSALLNGNLRSINRMLDPVTANAGDIDQNKINEAFREMAQSSDEKHFTSFLRLAMRHSGDIVRVSTEFMRELEPSIQDLAKRNIVRAALAGRLYLLPNEIQELTQRGSTRFVSRPIMQRYENIGTSDSAIESALQISLDEFKDTQARRPESERDSECPICSAAYDEDPDNKILKLPCNHCFHDQCVGFMRGSNGNKCPCCRRKFKIAF